jgi:methyl-accepting chemotaxis protein WspA
MKLRTKMIGVLTVVALFSAIVGVTSLRSIMKMSDADQKLYEDITVPLPELSDIAVTFQRMRVASRDFINAQGDAEKRAKFQKQLEDLRDETTNVVNSYQKRNLSAEMQSVFEDFKEARKNYEAYLFHIVELAKAGKDKEAWDILWSEGYNNEVNRELADITKMEKLKVEEGRKLSEANSALASSSTTQTTVVIFIGLVLAVGAGFWVTSISKPLARLADGIQVMSRGDFSKALSLAGGGEFAVLAERLNGMASELTVLIGSVKDSGVRVNTSATEIAATAQQQLATANEVAATTSQVGATSKQISATSKELMQSVKEVTEVAEKTAAIAGSGQQGLERIKTTMHQITEASASINAKLTVLSEKAGSIGTVVTTITKVADQTNLLSLNAAIEAEKAGEYGRGFSVVASEIRRLADQSALATTDIEQMVKEIQSAISAGVMGMDKFSEEVRRGVEVVRHVSDELTQIINQVQTLTVSFETVNEGMQSQSTGAQQISDALTQLGEASRQTVESLRQSNQAIEQLNSAARIMQNGVTRFVLPA